mgnify:CR=1 FL=1
MTPHYTFEQDQAEMFARNPELKALYEKQFLNDVLSLQIRNLRTSKDLTQLELAKKAGTTQSVIARIESGGQNISMKTLQKLLFALGATLKLEELGVVGPANGSKPREVYVD